MLDDDLRNVVELLLPPDKPVGRKEAPPCPQPRVPERDPVRTLGWDRRSAVPKGVATPGRVEAAGRGRPPRLVPGGDQQPFHPRAKNGAQTGPNPTDQAKTWAKRRLITEAQGILLAVTFTGASVYDSKGTLPTLKAILPIQDPRGRSRRRPQRSVGDTAHDSDPVRQTLRRLRIRDERLPAIHLAFLQWGCALICWRAFSQWC